MSNTARTTAQGSPVGQLLIRPNPFLGLLPREYWKSQKQYYGYVVEFLPATLSVTTTQVLQIQNDATFAVIAINAQLVGTDNSTHLANSVFTFQVFDSGVGRNWWSAPVQLDNVAGTGQNPGILKYPIIVKPGASLSCQITNLIATSYNVRILLDGFKIFPFDEPTS
jgi:hypothetical protein